MRHIEKFKKIFACCGKECTADTNGQALDQLVTLAENGELGGGSGGASGSSSPITTLKAYYLTPAVEAVIYIYFTKEITKTGSYMYMSFVDGSVHTINITEVNDDTFTDSNGNVYARAKKKDILIDAENELVEVELISGYDFNITSYNFITQTDNNGVIQENQRFNYSSSYYDATTECDLCVYGGSGKIGYYKIKA